MLGYKGYLWKVALLIAVAALLLAACGGAAPTAAPQAALAEAFKVGLIHPSPITDSWSGAAYEALKRMQSELGAEIANVEVGNPAGFEKAFSDFGSQNYNLIIGHGFQYQDAAEKVSPEFPKSFFTTVGGFKTTANFAPVDLVPGYKQAFYAMGVMAGNVSKSQKAAAFGLEIPAITMPLEGFVAGFKSIPGNECSLIMLKDGNDVGAAKEAALQAIADGADVLIANANLAGDGVIQAAAEKGAGVWVVGTISDKTSLAPKNVLVSSTLNVSAALFSLGKDVKEGKMKGGQVRGFTLKDEGVYDFIWNPDTASVVTPEIKAIAEDTLKKIKADEVKVP
jgi:simple sugar transport system substrate-binding protein